MKKVMLPMLLLLPITAIAQLPEQKLSKALLQTLGSSDDDTVVKIIVELNRKSRKAVKPEDILSARAIARRQKMVRAGILPDVLTDEDLPFDEQDVRELQKTGFQVRYLLTQLNLISGVVKKRQVVEISKLKCVKYIDKLSENNAQKIEKKKGFEESFLTMESQVMVQNAANSHRLDYGQSLSQLSQIGVPAVHDLGVTGRGVLIANFDAGFSNLTHEAFQGLNLTARYDFVAKREQLGGDSHGTATLGVLAANKSGVLIGAAFGASYALARTEDAASETPVEEDYWAAAALWADSLGADIITSSLGYRVFDRPFPSYTWQEMNGRTAISTRAAARAARVGIVVCNSAGNSGNIALPENTLVAPADADTILTVGAVNRAGIRTSFSSVGPTADGRIKPDVMAMGQGVFTTGISNATSYVSANGTSFSCPLVAGVAALMLSVNPTLTPVQVRDVLRRTASNAAAPNREIGWGIVNALAAVNSLRPQSTEKLIDAKPKECRLEQNYPNPFNPTTVISYQLPASSNVRLVIYDVLGRELQTLVSTRQNAGRYDVQFSVNNSQLSSGIYFYRLTAGKFIETKKMMLVK